MTPERRKVSICLKCGDFIYSDQDWTDDVPGWIGKAHVVCPEDE